MVTSIIRLGFTLRRQLYEAVYSKNNLSWTRLRTFLFYICLLLFFRALGGFGTVPGHAQVHCPLLKTDNRHLPIALVHEAKIAELRLRMWEEDRKAGLMQKRRLAARAMKKKSPPLAMLMERSTKTSEEGDEPTYVRSYGDNGDTMYETDVAPMPPKEPEPIVTQDVEVENLADPATADGTEAVVEQSNDAL
ncbi:hypothetical protein ONZ45_g2521 [Pleurotus djamor]|nr:hypothetical protein ONZ45_g2521 [Pleurotus djamor]